MNFGQKALQVLKTVAPTLGTAIGGPFGALAGTLVSAALGTSSGDDKGAETALLSATPDSLVKLRTAEMDFQKQMRELGISEEKLVYDDIANARGREIAVRDWTPRILAFLVVVLGAALEGWVITHGVPTGVDQVLAGRILGTIDAAIMLVLGYYFGSSIGSSESRQTLSSIAKQP